MSQTSDTKPESKVKAKKEVKPKPDGYLFGRPTLYKPEYCDMLISHMEKGFSFRSFAGVIRVDFDTLYEWDRTHRDFSDAKKIGHGLQLVYDENMLDDLSRGNHGKSASSATHIFKMKNCHKWVDKVESEVTTREIKINIDKDDAEL